jgi:hypothetical protein
MTVQGGRQAFPRTVCGQGGDGHSRACGHARVQRAHPGRGPMALPRTAQARGPVLAWQRGQQ